jgi:hypothetical protein
MGGGGGGAGGERQDDGNQTDWREAAAQIMIRWITSKDRPAMPDKSLLQKLGQSVVDALVMTLIAQIMTGPIMDENGMTNATQKRANRAMSKAKHEADQAMNDYKLLSPEAKKEWDEFMTGSGYDRIRESIKNSTGYLLPSDVAINVWLSGDSTPNLAKQITPPPPQQTASKKPKTPKPRRPRNPDRKPFT